MKNPMNRNSIVATRVGLIVGSVRPPPGDPENSPLRSVNRVTWTDEQTARVLKAVPLRGVVRRPATPQEKRVAA